MPGFRQQLLALVAPSFAKWTVARSGRSAIADQRRCLQQLLPALSQSQYGRRHHLRAGLDHAAFRREVPARTAEPFFPWVSRMMRGESDVLWPGKCARFVQVAGGQDGKPLFSPFTAGMQEHFSRAATMSLLLYAARAGGGAVARGVDLMTEVRTAPGPAAPPAVVMTLSAVLGTCRASWDADVRYWPDHDRAAPHAGDDAAHGALASIDGSAVRRITGRPSDLAFRGLELRDELERSGQLVTSLDALWPRLESLWHYGQPVELWSERLLEIHGRRLRLHALYVSGEIYMGAQEAAAADGLRLLTDAGVFYEFIPAAGLEESRLEHAGAQAVALEGVAAGIDYVPVVTTPGGLCRYVLPEAVRFVSTSPFRFLPRGPWRTQLNCSGERLLEGDLIDALTRVCRSHKWTLVHLHVAPLVASTLVGGKRARHEWWIELRPGSVENPTGPLLATELDADLGREHPAYAARRRSGELDAPLVRLAMPGVFGQWLQEAANPDAPPVCRNDRLIADGLARIARFADA